MRFYFYECFNLNCDGEKEMCCQFICDIPEYATPYCPNCSEDKEVKFVDTIEVDFNA